MVYTVCDSTLDVLYARLVDRAFGRHLRLLDSLLCCNSLDQTCLSTASFFFIKLQGTPLYVVRDESVLDEAR